LFELEEGDSGVLLSVVNRALTIPPAVVRRIPHEFIWVDEQMKNIQKHVAAS